MPAWARQAFTTAVTVPAGATEAVYATLPGVTIGPDDTGALVFGIVAFTTAASTTSVRVRVRRNTVSGTTVGDTGAVPVSASAVIDIPIVAFDAIGTEQVGIAYVITVTAAAAGAAGTAGLGAFAVLVR